MDVAAGSLEKGSKLPPGLLGPQCSACRVNKLREVPYEARDLVPMMRVKPETGTTDAEGCSEESACQLGYFHRFTSYVPTTPFC